MEPHQIVIDLAWWQAIFGLVLAVAGVGGLVGAILRLWIQPQVGKWIDLAQEREGKTTDAKLAILADRLDSCQKERSDRYRRLETDMARTEGRVEHDIGEIKNLLSGKDGLVFQMAEVKARVSDLTKSVDRLVTRNGKP